MSQNLVFFWVLFGPVCAFAVFGILAALTMLLGALIQGVSDGLLSIVQTWRGALVGDTNRKERGGR